MIRKARDKTAEAYCAGTGEHKTGVLKSSFVAEVKSDLMGEQTILCGLLQMAPILSTIKWWRKELKKANQVSSVRVE
jgi:ketol-acid reductoisomerase